MRLDPIDQQIIALLQEDARSSYAEIGSVVALSAPAVKRRVDRLRSDGVIRGYTALIDPDALGWTTEAFVELFCTGRTSPQQLRDAAKRHPAVVGAYTISGEADALVHLRATPGAVVLPANAREVAAVVALCHSAGVPAIHGS